MERDGVVDPGAGPPVDAAQRWFWTKRWQQREREVDEHMAAGRVRVHDDVDVLLTLLDDITAS